ncbi:MAG: glucose-6-phosphate dehydrogenase, partial [Woeseiaceae bacterium]|nr:glucose-6-phosphate dehydrogenase [Woeseiaceae bacterium]
MAELIPVESFDLIIFGGTGDLAMRKLMPALYHRDCDGQMTADSRIIAASRGALSRDDYLATVEASLRGSLPEDDFDEGHWGTFRNRLHYVQADALQHDQWGSIVDILAGREDSVRVAYLATAPSLFGPLATGLKANGLVTEKSRIVLEKPLGRDLESARAINNAVGDCFREDQIYRIDHYLTKEVVNNIAMIRFTNCVFEPLWSSRYID